MRDYKIAPSILSADFARLGEEVKNVLAASGARVGRPRLKVSVRSFSNYRLMRLSMV